MAVDGLNHFNIVAPRELLERVRDFYVQVLDLEEGYRPDFDFPGYWLYGGGRPLVHLMEGDRAGEAPADGGKTGHLDHIAFTCSELGQTEARLQSLGLDYRKREHPDYGLTQLFVHDPIGLGVELNFST